MIQKESSNRSQMYHLFLCLGVQVLFYLLGASYRKPNSKVLKQKEHLLAIK